MSETPKFAKPFVGINLPHAKVHNSMVRKRNGNIVPMNYDEITLRISGLCVGLFGMVDPVKVAQLVIRDIPDGVVETQMLDVLAYERAASLVLENPAYDVLAARIAVSNHHKNTVEWKEFSQTIEKLYNNGGKTHKNKPVRHISEQAYRFIMKHKIVLDSAIDYNRDYDIKYAGIRTLLDKYFLRVDGVPVERYQHIHMRVAVQLYMNMDSTESSDDSIAIEEIIHAYNELSLQKGTHASPTLFNSCTPNPYLASCFLLDCEDSVEGMYHKCMSACATISKGAGGIGVDLSGIRAAGSMIHSTERPAKGVLSFLKVLNQFVRHIDQGGKRNAAVACYISDWHPEVFDVIQAANEHALEEKRAHKLFYGFWTTDLFMTRVESNQSWTLMCPDSFPGLRDAYGPTFKELYERYESEIDAGIHVGKIYKRIKAHELWQLVTESQIQTGHPYVVFKDAINMKSNQMNIGTIYNSNLCTEIVEYSRPDEIAVCNLASLTLVKFVKFYDDTGKPYFDFGALHKTTQLLTRNLNRCIDRMKYELPETKKSNLTHRPIGLGVTGLADVFTLMRYPFDSENARLLNRQIFETIYHGALYASWELAKKDGPYESFRWNGGSPISRGQFQFDMWAELGQFDKSTLTRNDWDDLRQKIMVDGVRNSLLVAPMPTASTSFIMGQTECFEPRQTNMFRRDTSAGNFITLNEHMVFDLMNLGLWEKYKDSIEFNGGSIQHIDEIPDDIKLLYRTVWEIKQIPLIQMAADRGAFIDQTQSFNYHIPNPDTKKATTVHFTAWKLGLKSSYYMRTKVHQTATRVVAKSKMQDTKESEKTEKAEKSTVKIVGDKKIVCTDEICTSCAL